MLSGLTMKSPLNSGRRHTVIRTESPGLSTIGSAEAAGVCARTPSDSVDCAMMQHQNVSSSFRIFLTGASKVAAQSTRFDLIRAQWLSNGAGERRNYAEVPSTNR